VSGNLKIFAKAVAGSLKFDVNEDTIELKDATLGDETMSIIVGDHQVVGVDLNPESGRSFSMLVSSENENNLSLQVSPTLDVRVALTFKHAWEAFANELDDLPQVLADDILGIRLDGSDTPTIEIVSTDEETDMRVASGTLTLSSPNMNEEVVVEEGMCMGSQDDEDVTDEERDARHDLFGGLVGVMCGG
jgi:hypothetical protein